jgi:transposase
MNVKNYYQDQGLLFPPHLRDCLPDDHQVVIINDVVETLNLSGLYRKVSSEGHPAYHPKMMLKVLIYAYANGIFSSRKIQAALQESIAFIYLAAWQKPDFRTISDFRQHNLAEFQELFSQVVDVCRQLGMISLGHIAIDGSKFKANAADSRTYDRQRVQQAIQELLQQADQLDQGEDRLYGPDNPGASVPEAVRKQKDRLEKLQQIKKQLDQSDREKTNATDPEAVFMKNGGRLRTSYNGQIAVDENQIIVAAEVTNDPSDTEQLIPMVEQTERRIGPLDKLSADSGYSQGETLQALADKKIDAHIPDANYQGCRRGKTEAPGPGLFPRSSFQRDEQQDCFICPLGQKLTFVRMQKVKHKKPLRLYRCHTCQECPQRDRCTKSRQGRSLTLNAYDDQFRAMRTKLDSPHGRRIYSRRQTMVEPVFGHIKGVLGFCQFHLRGLLKVGGEFALVCIAHNVRKIINQLKVPSPLGPRRVVEGATA